MTPAECAKILAIAATIDPRLRPPSLDDATARAQAWSQVLDYRMPLDWATRAVARHYAESTDSLMPAHLNTVYRAERRAEADRLAAEQALTPGEGVPMPEELKARWSALTSGRS